MVGFPCGVRAGSGSSGSGAVLCPDTPGKLPVDCAPECRIGEHGTVHLRLHYEGMSMLVEFFCHIVLKAYSVGSPLFIYVVQKLLVHAEPKEIILHLCSDRKSVV